MVCDDVRTEIGNKDILVGVYTAGMTVAALPWFGTICLWLAVMWSGEGMATVEVRILNPRHASSGETQGVFNSIWRGYESSLTFRHIFINVDVEGPHEIQWRLENGNWETIRHFPIYLAKT
jgi:hypothetical protein